MTKLTGCVALPSRCIYQVSNWYLKTCWKKTPDNFSLAGSSTYSPIRVFLSARGPKIAQPRHSLYQCVYQIWGLYIIFEAMNAEKWRPIFGCKVGQSVPIGMKLELDVWHYLLNIYTMFQNDISKHVEKKARKTSQNPKRAKIIAKIPKIGFLKKRNLCRKVYSGPSTYQIWRIYLDL